MAAVFQQVLAQDAKFTPYRTPGRGGFSTLYIRRRTQLLREAAHRHPSAHETRREYLKLRSSILTEKYGPIAYSDQGSLISKRSLSTAGSYRGGGRKMGSQPQPPISETSIADTVSRIAPTNAAEASRALVGGKSIGETYAFTGVYHIFDQHREPITRIKFAHNDRCQVACSSKDWSLSVMLLLPSPPSVISSLSGHQGPVNDFDWSSANDIILSASSDGTARLWNVARSECLRIFSQSPGVSVTACAFLPLNNNLFAIGKNDGGVQVVNVSTGKRVHGGAAKTPSSGGEIMCLSFDPDGTQLWCGDLAGNIISAVCSPSTGRLTKCKAFAVAPGRPVTSVSSRAWVSREARDPSLLLNIGNNSLCLFKLSHGGLFLKKKFDIRQSKERVKSSFCPIMSFCEGACVVTGSEDATVYFFDVESDGSNPCVNKLQGHSVPVVDVCFNYDESLLASADTSGVVIVWKREGRAL